MASASSGPGATGKREPRTYTRRRGERAANSVVKALIRFGLVPSSYVLTTRGRKTGLDRRVPVSIVQQGERRFLVAPYGAVSWVHNARAAGRVSLSRRGRAVEYAVREVSPTEAGPVLKQYVKLARATRPYFAAHVDDPVEAFAAEAARHPVFELTRADDASG